MPDLVQVSSMRTRDLRHQLWIVIAKNLDHAEKLFSSKRKDYKLLFATSQDSINIFKPLSTFL